MAGEKGATFCNDLLKLIFNAVNIAGIADNASSSPLTVFYAGLHTADPLAGGNQTTSEASYTGYARVSVARASGGFTVSGASASLTSPVTFGTPTGGAGQVLTYFSIGTAASGTGKVLYTGPVAPSVTVVTGTPPQLTTGTVITEA